MMMLTRVLLKMVNHTVLTKLSIEKKLFFARAVNLICYSNVDREAEKL